MSHKYIRPNRSFFHKLTQRKVVEEIAVKRVSTRLISVLVRYKRHVVKVVGVNGVVHALTVKRPDERLFNHYAASQV